MLDLWIQVNVAIGIIALAFLFAHWITGTDPPDTAAREHTESRMPRSSRSSKD